MFYTQWYIGQGYTLHPSYPLLLPWVHNSVLCAFVSTSPCKSVHLYRSFSRFQIPVFIDDICFSLSGWLQSVFWSYFQGHSWREMDAMGVCLRNGLQESASPDCSLSSRTVFTTTQSVLRWSVSQFLCKHSDQSL